MLHSDPFQTAIEHIATSMDPAIVRQARQVADGPVTAVIIHSAAMTFDKLFSGIAERFENCGERNAAQSASDWNTNVDSLKIDFTGGKIEKLSRNGKFTRLQVGISDCAPMEAAIEDV